MVTVRALAAADAEAVVPMALLIEQLRGDDAEDQAGVLAAARFGALDWVERHVGRSLQRRAWTADFDAPHSRVRLPFGPVADVTELRFAVRDGVPQIWPSSSYRLTGDELVTATGLSWRGAMGDYRVSVDYVAGYQDLATEAPALLTAVLMLAAHFYRNREENAATAMAKMPFGVEMLCAPYRQPVIG